MLNRFLVIIAIAVGGSAFAQVGTVPHSGAQSGDNWRTTLIDSVRTPSWCQHLHHPREDVCGSIKQTESETERLGLDKGNGPAKHGAPPFTRAHSEMIYDVLRVGAGGTVTGIDIEC